MYLTKLIPKFKRSGSVTALILSLFLFPSHKASSEDFMDPWSEKSFVILMSTKSYDNARKVAEEASKSLKIKLNSRGLSPHIITGLTFDEKTCLAPPIEDYPCYVRREKYDDGEYISIEYSTEYKEMKPGYYIVIAFSGDKKTTITVLSKSKTHFKDASQKTVKIYMPGE
jgi:hypothetical protein